MNAAQHRRWDPFAWFILSLIAVVAIYAAVSTYANGRADSVRQDASIRENSANQITSCENANESREASRALWGYVIDLSSRSAKPEQVAFFEEFRQYVNTVYQPHDCSRLDKKYPLPDPPKVPAAP